MENMMTKFDIIFVLPYTFSDHPSFPEGILKRVLEAEGYSVGIIQRPDWQDPESFSVLGAPRLFFAIIQGPVDSVVLNYTSSRKRRMEDLYQIDGSAFFPDSPKSIKFKIRPDRAVVVFANRIRQVFKQVPIVIGGIEASLRRFVHYDFQEDKIKRSILFDSRADLLVTGMGEKQILEIAGQANRGKIIKEMEIPGTARIAKDINEYKDYIELPSLAEISEEPVKLMEAARQCEKAGIVGQGLIQAHEGRYVIDHPAMKYEASDIDAIYNHHYSRRHPGIKKKKMISPALRMNLFSVTSHRGCGGGCAFCSITAHEGKRILSRSMDSILNEIENFNRHPLWKGIVSDIGGGTAELYGSDCHNQKCKRSSCFVAETCKRIRSTDHYLTLLRRAREIKGVRQIFLGSGIRYDLMLQNPTLLEEIMRFHCGKYLRVAPEHTETGVLDLMRKPGFEVFEAFVDLFHRINGKLKRKIQLAPYLIIGHPGETYQDVYRMRDRLRRLKLPTQDVQIFTPTPGSLSTAMYYTGISPQFNDVPVERDIKSLLKRKRILTGT
jgi:uncharacterized radical SAM protein YgiQ